MKFGKRLLEQLHPEWACAYLPYETLKQCALRHTNPHGLPRMEFRSPLPFCPPVERRILKRLSTDPEAEEPLKSDACRAEGDFLSALMSAIQVVNTFYKTKETAYEQQLEELLKTLASPQNWLLERPNFDEAEPDFSTVAAALEAEVHVPPPQREALDSFLKLCAEIDLLRKFSVRPRAHGRSERHWPRGPL